MESHRKDDDRGAAIAAVRCQNVIVLTYQPVLEVAPARKTYDTDILFTKRIRNDGMLQFVIVIGMGVIEDEAWFFFEKLVAARMNVSHP